MPEKRSDILISRAANALRKAAVLDRTRRSELAGIADYLESIVYEAVLREPPQRKRDDSPRQDDVALPKDIKKMMKPFKVRLVR
jgi:hypothetical protein